MAHPTSERMGTVVPPSDLHVVPPRLKVSTVVAGSGFFGVFVQIASAATNVNKIPRMMVLRFMVQFLCKRGDVSFGKTGMVWAAAPLGRVFWDAFREETIDKSGKGENTVRVR